eukprot:NODE_1606_length_1442_cov_21.317871_g1523_i0.p2 GENE.NODE_1606_length_1442_cov_21.317871_g1523_i0~~NODE_1606_length_1442_cov_21.317871_g1523_i0.p2  ORF type:complete len:196 (+),score=44.35 NODE_1606_length_1442_cov_21.317871_g1523_i0:828-1415(+)
MFGHIFQLAEAISNGAQTSSAHTNVVLRRIPEITPPEVLHLTGAAEAQKNFHSILEVDPSEVQHYDCVVFGFATRFGSIPSQLTQFLEILDLVTTPFTFVGKVGGVFTCTGTQHGGQEASLLQFQHYMLQKGMVLVGLPPNMGTYFSTATPQGGTPYGASMLAAPDGKRSLSEWERETASVFGRHLANITQALVE